MKKIYLIPILLLLLSGCSAKNNLMSVFNARENPTITEVSVGKYEAPSGVEYSLIQYGSGFYVKNGSGTILELKTEASGTGANTNTGVNAGSGKVDINKTTFKDIISMKKALDSKNPLIVDKYTTPNGKAFQITNYKGVFGIIYPDGKKGTGTFATKEGLVEFLKVNNKACVVNISRPYYLENNDSGGYDIYDKDEKKYLGYSQNIQLYPPMDCGKGQFVDLSLDERNIGTDDYLLLSNYHGEFKLPSGTNIDIGPRFGYVSSPNKEETVNNINGVKGIKISKPGIANIKTLKEACNNVEGGMDEKSCNEFVARRQKEYVINGAFGIGLPFIITIESKEKANNIYTELLDIMKNEKELPLTRIIRKINWSKINTENIKFGQPDSKSITFFDTYGSQKIKIVKSKSVDWDICSPSDVSIGLQCVYEGYDKKTNSIIVHRFVSTNHTDRPVEPGDDETFRINVDNWNTVKIK